MSICEKHIAFKLVWEIKKSIFLVENKEGSLGSTSAFQTHWLSNIPVQSLLV
jgi:hypothetical protein